MYAKASDSSHYGIDVRDGKVKDCCEAGVLDSMETKSWALKLAFDVVLTILKVD
jgi:chaperonin GroEL (HSP60 family)